MQTGALSVAASRLHQACGTLNMAWSAPLQLGMALVLLWRALGRPVLGGIAVMLLLWPVQARLSRMLAHQRILTARATDIRL